MTDFNEIRLQTEKPENPFTEPEPPNEPELPDVPPVEPNPYPVTDPIPDPNPNDPFPVPPEPITGDRILSKGIAEFLGGDGCERQHG